VCCRALSSWKRGCSIWGPTLPSRFFGFRSISQYRSELTFVSVGMISEGTKPLKSQKVSGWLHQQRATLNFVCAGDPLWQNSSNHSPNHIDRRQVFCSQTHYHFKPFHPHWLAYTYNSELCSCRNLQFGPTVWKSLINKRHLNMYSCLCFPSTEQCSCQPSVLPSDDGVHL